MAVFDYEICVDLHVRVYQIDKILTIKLRFNGIWENDKKPDNLPASYSNTTGQNSNLNIYSLNANGLNYKAFDVDSLMQNLACACHRISGSWATHVCTYIPIYVYKTELGLQYMTAE